MLKLIIYGDTGTGYPFEVILEKASKQEFWIAPGDFSSKTNERQQSTLPGI
jgi:hypothetical protein